MPIRDASAERHAADGDRHVGPVAAVGGDERLVVHLVDVVAGEDDDGVRRVVLDDVDVAQDRVGRAAVPLGDRPRAMYGWRSLTPPRLRSRSHGRPEADVVVERARVVLGQDDDVVDVRVDAVRQREVDDPVLAAERHGRLGALLRTGSRGARPRRRRGSPPSSASRSDASTRQVERRLTGRCRIVSPARRCAAGRRPRRPTAYRNSRGFTKSPLSSTIQWRCAPVEWPVLPS